MEPEKVTDGWARRIGEDWYAWASADYAPERAWIALELSEPRPLRELHLTFDSDLGKPMSLTHSDRYHARMVQGTPGTLVQAYRVQGRHDGDWTDLATVEGNYQRKRVHHFDGVTASAVRIECFRSVASDHARIQQIRWYA